MCNIQKSRIFALGDYHQQSVVSSRVALHILFRRQGGDASINLITEINRNMKTFANIVWLLCGGLEAAFGYFTGSLALAITIIGIPFAMQAFKIGLLCLWPFGARVIPTASPTGCLRVFMNFIWFMCGGIFAWLMHAFFGLFLYITIIGIPWGKQHFKMAGLALAPFGKDVELDY